MRRYNVVAIVQDESQSVMEAAMVDKLSVVQNAFWYNTQEKKPEGKYSLMRKGLTISLIMQFADEIYGHFSLLVLQVQNQRKLEGSVWRN